MPRSSEHESAPESMASVAVELEAALGDRGIDRVEAGVAREAIRAQLFGGDDRTQPIGQRKEIELGRYQVLQRIGRGGMGTVYLVFDPELDRKIAVKVLHHGVGSPEDSRQARARIRREAMAMAKLTHPNVVRIYDVGESEGQLFIAMEYAEGGTLRQWQATGEQRWPAILARYLAAGEGLAAAHRAGLVHRDFKPDNVLLDGEGRAMVSDFGLVRPIDRLLSLGDGPAARATHEDLLEVADQLTTVTQTGAAVGTPAYMAPEQLAGRYDARSDQFAFCIALLEAVGRRHPFQRDTLAATLLAAANEDLNPPVPGTTPAWLLKVLRRGLRAAPDKRWPDMPALLSALRAGHERRRRTLVGLGSAAVGVVAVASYLANSPDATDRAASPTDPLCASTGAQIESAWTPEGRAAFRTAMVDAAANRDRATADDVVARLDAYATELRTLHERVCSTGDGSQTTVATRALCLSWRATEFTALTDLLRDDAGSMVPVAVSMVEALASPQSCDDPRALRGMLVVPEEPAMQEQVREVRREIANAHVLRSTGRFAEARALLARIEPRVPAEVPALGALVLYEKAQIDVRSGELERGMAALEQVALRAQAAAYDELALSASRKRLELLVETRRFDEAAKWRERASALAERLGDERSILVIELHHGEILLRQGRIDEALDVQRETLARGEARLGVDDPELAYAHDYLAGSLAQLGRFDEAIEHKRRCLSMLEGVLGPDSVDLPVVLRSAGNVHRMAGRRSEARGFYERGVAIIERQLGPDNARLEPLLFDLADWHADEGEYDRAIALYRRTLELASTGDPSRARISIARAHVLAGRFDRAEAELDALGETSAAASSVRAELHLMRGDRRLALVHARAAVEAVRADGVEDRRVEVVPLSLLAWAQAENRQRADAERTLAEVEAIVASNVGFEPAERWWAAKARVAVARGRRDADATKTAERELARWSRVAFGRTP